MSWGVPMVGKGLHISALFSRSTTTGAKFGQGPNLASVVVRQGKYTPICNPLLAMRTPLRTYTVTVIKQHLPVARHNVRVQVQAHLYLSVVAGVVKPNLSH